MVDKTSTAQILSSKSGFNSYDWFTILEFKVYAIKKRPENSIQDVFVFEIF